MPTAVARTSAISATTPAPTGPDPSVVPRRKQQGEGVRSAYGVWAPGISDTDRTEVINKRADKSVALSCPNGTCE